MNLRVVQANETKPSYAISGEHLRKARDIVHNWALHQGATNVTNELIDLAQQVAEGLERAWKDGRDSMERKF